jgi:hypothetical protein
MENESHEAPDDEKTSSEKKDKKARKRKWWKSSLIAAMIPLSTGIYAQITKWKEMALAEKEQHHKTQMAFLSAATDTNRRLEDRKQVLRFLIAVPEDASIRSWAQTELDYVEEDINKVKKERDMYLDALVAARKEQRALPLATSFAITNTRVGVLGSAALWGSSSDVYPSTLVGRATFGTVEAAEPLLRIAGSDSVLDATTGTFRFVGSSLGQKKEQRRDGPE